MRNPLPLFWSSTFFSVLLISIFKVPFLGRKCQKQSFPLFCVCSGIKGSRSWTEFLFGYSVTTEARHNPCQLVPASIRLSTPEVGNGLPTLFILSSVIHSKCWASQYRHQTNPRLNSSEVLAVPRLFWYAWASWIAWQPPCLQNMPWCRKKPSHPIRDPLHWLLQGVCWSSSSWFGHRAQ